LQQFLEKNSKAISLGDKIAQTNPDVILHYNGSVDPHIWMDISLWAKTIPSIVRALSEKDPQHADDFQKNGDQLQQQMLETHRQVLGVLGKIPEKQRFLVTSHDAFNYFARAYLADANERETGEWQKRFAAPEGLAPESQLSTINIQAIIDYLKETQVHVLFPESNLSKDSIRKIVSAGSENGLDLVIATDVLYGDAMGKSGSDADTYLKMIEHNARVIAKYLNRPHQQEDEEIH
jgi:manganese/zinc/iron transport system substrate-binding protein